MNYTLNQLNIFLKIYQTKSITKAAEELFLSQPAVSIQLRNFQQQFDIPLTEIVGRKLYITAFGKEVALAAENILNEVYKINYKTQSFKGQLTGRLTISVVSTGKYVMPFFLADFLKNNTGVDLSLDVTNKSKVIESLQKNEVDFSLVSVLPDNVSIDRLELMQNKLYLIANKDQVFKKKKYQDKSILETLPLIYREEGSGTRYVMEKYLNEQSIYIRKKMELSTNEAVKQAVIAGLGCSIMPLIGIKNELQNGELQIVPIKEFPLTSTWNLVWLKEKKLSPVASAFLDYLRKETSNIVADKFEWFEEY